MNRYLLCALLLCPSIVAGQPIGWSDISSQFSLPPGIAIFRGERASPPLRATYIDVDPGNSKIVVYPFLSGAPAGKETVPAFVSRVNAIAAVNGGYFGGSSSYSALVQAGVLQAQNVQVLTRTAGTFYATRSLFSLNARRAPRIDWIYHFDATASGIFRFAAPSANTPTTPAPVPQQSQGIRLDSIFAAIGGGPRLIERGAVRVTYNEEVFFESGIDGTNRQPRTAVGFTAGGHILLLTVDGRQTASSGLTLEELAQLLVERGCVEAMNLDGGGSTQMAVGSQYVNTPSEQREVPSFLAVVYADSVRFPRPVLFEKTIDADDKSSCRFAGSGWFTSANPGYWGGTPAWLNPVGDGSSSARFMLRLPTSGTYEAQAWWVPSSNRATNTPYIITRKSGVDTVRVDQTGGGSRWNVLGTYAFSGDTSESITVTNAATGGNYVVADGIRIISYEPVTSVRSREAGVLPVSIHLSAYPNPGNGEIAFLVRIAEAGLTELALFDLLGREVGLVVNEVLPPGTHALRFRSGHLASGLYIARLTSGAAVTTRKILLQK